MPLTTLINRPATITRRLSSADRDAHGREIPDEELVETVCEIQQRTRREATDADEVSDTFWTAYFLPGETVNTGDTVRVDGLGEFEVIGDPWAARNPSTQADSHVEATLRRTRGPEDGS